MQYIITANISSYTVLCRLTQTSVLNDRIFDHVSAHQAFVQLWTLVFLSYTGGWLSNSAPIPRARIVVRAIRHSSFIGRQHFIHDNSHIEDRYGASDIRKGDM